MRNETKKRNGIIDEKEKLKELNKISENKLKDKERKYIEENDRIKWIN